MMLFASTRKSAHLPVVELAFTAVLLTSFTINHQMVYGEETPANSHNASAAEESVSPSELNEASSVHGSANKANSEKASPSALPSHSATTTEKASDSKSAEKTIASDTAAPEDKNLTEATPKAAEEKKEQKKTEASPKNDEATKSDDAAKASETAKEEDTAKKPKVAGEPLAPGMMQLLKEEILAGVKKRGTMENLAKFQSYAIGRVNASAGRYTGSELTGNCRLSWYDFMMRHLIDAPAAAERFTRELHTAVCDEREGLPKALSIIAVKMDAGNRKPRQFGAVTSPEQAMEIIEQALTEAQVDFNASLSPLSKSELRELQNNLVPVLCTQNQVGHTLNDRGTGRRLCDLLEKMDRVSLHSAAEALSPISDPQLLEQLKSLHYNGNVQVPGVTGRVLARIETQSGVILVGGKEKNTYQLDQMRDVAAIIDLGGGDTFIEGTVGLDRPVLVIIDLGENNVYRGVKPGIQGAAVLGVSMLVNVGGNNVYEAKDVAQGSCLAGVGILIDYGSNNRYRGVRRVQGQALGGIGILIGRGGKNDYHAAMWAQGFGNPLGFGLLDNVVGNNHYYCGGMWRDSYPETPGCEGWGQGVGAGIRQVADGGIGVILDNGGENTYEFDYLSHGGGYWCGIGFARDFGGNTKRLITRTAYDGGPRTQPKFQRFGCGWGCHYSVGFCFDDSGDDVYEGTIMGSGMAWDCSLGALCDFGGNDHYTATGGLTQGTGGQMGFGILFDYNGNDVYEGYGQGYASPSMTYHDQNSCGGNFAFLIDYGGKDKYGCDADNNSYIKRGCTGGFLIDRPRQEEIDATAAKPATDKTNGL
jgi:hypothetical protein